MKKRSRFSDVGVIFFVSRTENLVPILYQKPRNEIVSNKNRLQLQAVTY